MFTRFACPNPSAHLRGSFVFVSAIVFVAALLAGCEGGSSNTFEGTVPNLAPVNPGGGNNPIPPAVTRNAVYAATNGAGANAIIAYRRATDGTLSPLATYPTNGAGSGVGHIPELDAEEGIDPLRSNYSVYLTPNGQYLYAVNTVSATIAAFRVNTTDGTLTFIETEPSGGQFPNSIAASNNRLYVSNVGNPGGGVPTVVAGFAINGDGSLQRIAGNGTRPTSNLPGAYPSALTISRDGRFLAVTEQYANRITTYVVNGDGTLSVPVVNVSAAVNPFGMSFLNNSNVLIVAEEQGGLISGVLRASASTYRVNEDGTLTQISNQIANGNTSSCWTLSTPDDRFAYTINSDNATITRYNIAGNGSITVGAADAAVLPINAVPIDFDISSDGQFLYSTLSGAGGGGGVAMWRIESDGTLTGLGRTDGLPELGTQGLAAF